MTAPPIEPPDDEALESEEDLDSEPRRRWKPNAELLRALADARRDLKPGESSLFWDWTTTRDTAPEAEDVRPSGEGEVFVHEKDAAAAYIAKVEVAPAAPPRQCTKSRIRVRPDVDPRRQPTVRTARDSRTSGAPEPGQTVAAFHEVGDSASPAPRTSSPSWPGDATGSWPPDSQRGDRPAFSSIPGAAVLPAPDRRRRVALALFVGVLSGTAAFFWLRTPHDPGTAPPAPPPACTVDEGQRPDAAPSAGPAPDKGAPKAPGKAGSETEEALSDSAPPETPLAPQAGPSKSVPHPGKPVGARGDTSVTPRASAVSQGGAGLLIRKKGSN
ncbi:MAG: hypothetical protein U0441_28035 [Polyangiaceae bacterium]